MYHIDIQRFLKFMELKQKSSVFKFNVEFKKIPRVFEQQLLKQKWIMKSEKDDMLYLDKPNELFEGIGVLDLLGTYDSISHTISLYDSAINLCATELNFEYDVLSKVIYYHELAHAATHLGSGKRSGEWIEFKKASTQDKEYFAQIYTYKMLEQDGDTFACQLMDELTKSQPSIYKGYQKDISKPINEINMDLLKKRHYLYRDNDCPGDDVFLRELKSGNIDFLKRKSWCLLHIKDPHRKEMIKILSGFISKEPEKAFNLIERLHGLEYVSNMIRHVYSSNIRFTLEVILDSCYYCNGENFKRYGYTDEEIYSAIKLIESNRIISKFEHESSSFDKSRFE